MKIEIDLYSDWKKIILDYIPYVDSIGFKFLSFEKWKLNQKIEKNIAKNNLMNEYNDYLINKFMTYKSRIIEPKARIVKISKEFICPDDLKKGFENFKNKVEKGESLLPYMSKKIFDADYDDDMLYDWGIYHFHLGMEQDEYKNNNISVKRTGEILYACLDEENFYVINIAKHGEWENIELLEIIKKNFPKLLEKFKINKFKISGENFDKNKHKNLRKNHLLSFIELDGECYMPPGYGVNSSGGSILALLQIDRICSFYNEAEEILKEEVLKIREKIEKKEEKRKNIKLIMKKLEDDKVTVFCDELKFNLILPYDKLVNNFEKVILAFEE